MPVILSELHSAMRPVRRFTEVSSVPSGDMGPSGSYGRVGIAHIPAAEMRTCNRHEKGTPRGACNICYPIARFTRCLPLRLLGTGNLAGLEAVGADVHLATMTVNDNVHTLDVGTELTDGDAVRVADGATSNRVLTADLTNLGHIR